ncbi:MAG: twin-arginine translocase TatA/TatE family subunit [Acidobacteriia bacterium]|nr:twin-arginine translocase TatA/TatE family subunit [Terriglobia bacterium]
MNLGMPELIFIFVLALLIFGPKKLPELGKTIGKGLAEFKRASNELKSSLEEEISTVQTSAKDAFGEPAKLLEGVLDTKPEAKTEVKSEAVPAKEIPTPTEGSTPNHG